MYHASQSESERIAVARALDYAYRQAMGMRPPSSTAEVLSGLRAAGFVPSELADLVTDTLKGKEVPVPANLLALALKTMPRRGL